MWQSFRSRVSHGSIVVITFLCCFALASTDENVCNSDECKRVAKVFLDNRDITFDPCDNFYRYACGGFIENPDVPDEEKQKGFFGNMSNMVSSQLREMLEKENDKASSKLPFVKLVKILYNQCMDTDATDKNGLEPLHKILKSFGGWPVIVGDSWDEKNFDWLKEYFLLTDAGYLDYLFSFFVFADDKNTTRRIITVYKPTLGTYEHFLLNGFNDSQVNAYYQFLVRSAVLLGANEESATQELRDSLDFEMRLANKLGAFCECLRIAVNHTEDSIGVCSQDVNWRLFGYNCAEKKVWWIQLN